MPDIGAWFTALNPFSSEVPSNAIWDNNGTVAAWKKAVTAAGGAPQSGGYPYEPFKGQPYGRFVDPTVPLGVRYELAPANVRSVIAAGQVGNKVAIVEGKAAETAEEVVKATGLDKGLSGLIGKALGMPPGLVIGVALVIGVGVGYAMLVNIGAVPPLNKLTKGD